MSSFHLQTRCCFFSVCLCWSFTHRDLTVRSGSHYKLWYLAKAASANRDFIVHFTAAHKETITQKAMKVFFFYYRGSSVSLFKHKDLRCAFICSNLHFLTSSLLPTPEKVDFFYSFNALCRDKRRGSCRRRSQRGNERVSSAEVLNQMWHLKRLTSLKTKMATESRCKEEKGKKWGKQGGMLA